MSKEAQAMAVVQPRQRKRASAIRPSSTRAASLRMSPQTGFETSTDAVAFGSSPALRGWRKWSRTASLNIFFARSKRDFFASARRSRIVRENSFYCILGLGLGFARVRAEGALEDGFGEGLRRRREPLGVLAPEGGPAIHLGAVPLLFQSGKAAKEQLAGVGDQGGPAARDAAVGDELEEIAEDVIDGGCRGEIAQRAEELGGMAGSVLASLDRQAEVMSAEGGFGA